jgi:hypothetical protein
MQEAITPAQYQAFQEAYDFFNVELFNASLPHVLVTLQRKAKAKGYFSPERFSGRVEETAAHELAMNPDHFTGRSDEEILSTLVHEMAHVWRQGNGKPPRPAYHDRKWAEKMKDIGLYPTSTGAPGGKETGQSVTHYIVSEGRYALSFSKLQANGFQLRWQSVAPGANAQAKAKKASKTKYTCPSCDQNAWAKPDASLICGNCYEEGDVVILLAEPGEEDDG